MRKLVMLLLAVMSVLPTAAYAQATNRILTGRVEDAENHQGIAAATLQIVGGRQAAQTNDQGAYRLALPTGPAVVNVRALGYRQRQIIVAGTDTTLMVTLDKVALQLNEVVVTGAATTQERRNVATAVSTVGADEVSALPSASLDNALQGRVPGATINMNSGAPGGGAQMQIRGVTTILGNGDPLYVVDGVIISNVTLSPGTAAITHASGGFPAGAPQSNMDNAVNRLADINPDEVETIQILKSAAATAIYGSQATNGVVLITTKRGRAGASTIHVSETVGQYQPQRLLGSRHFNAQTLAAVHNSPAWASYVQQACPGTGPTSCPYYDYQGAMYGNRSLAYETAADVSGGTDDIRYFATVRDKWEPGTLLNTGARRQSGRLNFDETFSTRWTANLSSSVYRSVTARGVSNNDNDFTSPIYAFSYTPAVVDLQQRDAAGRYIDNKALNLIVGTGANPFQVMDEIRSQEDVWRIVGGGNLKFSALSTPSQSLVLQMNGGFDSFNDNGQTYAPPYLQTQLQYGALAGEAVQTNGYNKQLNGTLSAVHTWTPASVPGLTSATTSAGAQYEQRYLNAYSMLARGLIPGLQLFNQGAPTLYQQITDVRDQAFFVNEELLGFGENLSVSGRVRAERSSANGDRSKFYYFPAASAAYHLPRVASWTDDIKLRAAIGLSGNQPTYGARDQVIANPGVIGGLNALAAPPNVGNPLIRPETMRETEIGTDAQLFNSRVGIEASYFVRNISDLLLQEALAPSAGYSTAFINSGHMQTKGVEVALTLLPVRNRSFTWTARPTFSKSTSRIVSLPVPPFVIPASGFGATSGSFGSGRIAAGYKSTLIWGNMPRANGTIVDTALADANPKFQAGLSNDVQFKNVSLSALLDWRKGGAVLDMTQYLMDEGQNSWDYDHASPDPKFTSLGAYRYGTWNGGRDVRVYVQDGSYVKLREVVLQYTLPANLSARAFGGHDVRVSLSGRNLYTWTKYWSFDPEVNNFGDQQVVRFVDIAPYPTSRSVFLGVSLSF